MHDGSRTARGFTLIELLVVIAIIGILSAVILASLSTARSGGNNAAIQSNLQSIRTEAEIYYETTGNNSYGASAGACQPSSGSSVFYADTTVRAAIASAIADSPKTASPYANCLACPMSSGSEGCTGNAQYYAINIQINSTTSAQTFWCIDSSGNSKVEYGTKGQSSNSICQ